MATRNLRDSGALLQALHDDPSLDLRWPTPTSPNACDCLDSALRSLIPPPRLQLSQWIESNIRLPESVSALPGATGGSRRLTDGLHRIEIKPPGRSAPIRVDPRRPRTRPPPAWPTCRPPKGRRPAPRPVPPGCLQT